MNLITEIQYFPSVILYKYLYKYSNIVFEEYENYQKMSFRNRCIIAGANGPIVLSIPLEAGRNQKTLTKDVKISNTMKWQSQHWRSIESSYNKSPWFEFYKDELMALYNKSVEFLMDWNISCFEWSIKRLGEVFVFSGSKSFIKQYDPGEFLDLRNAILPKNYTAFEQVKYAQVFEDRTGFMPNLSILDLLFCEGKNSGNLLKSQPL
jgi:hypothetical protein